MFIKEWFFLKKNRMLLNNNTDASWCRSHYISNTMIYLLLYDIWARIMRIALICCIDIYTVPHACVLIPPPPSPQQKINTDAPFSMYLLFSCPHDCITFKKNINLGFWVCSKMLHYMAWSILCHITRSWRNYDATIAYKLANF